MRLRGVAFMTVLAVWTGLAVLESALRSVCLFYKVQRNEAIVAVLTVLAVAAVMAVSVMTATPLKLNPPFSVILRIYVLITYPSHYIIFSRFE